jgi:hypothetical protein
MDRKQQLQPLAWFPKLPNWQISRGLSFRNSQLIFAWRSNYDNKDRPAHGLRLTDAKGYRQSDGAVLKLQSSRERNSKARRVPPSEELIHDAGQSAFDSDYR